MIDNVCLLSMRETWTKIYINEYLWYHCILLVFSSRIKWILNNEIGRSNRMMKHACFFVIRLLRPICLFNILLICLGETNTLTSLFFLLYHSRHGVDISNMFMTRRHTMMKNISFYHWMPFRHEQVRYQCHSANGKVMTLIVQYWMLWYHKHLVCYIFLSNSSLIERRQIMFWLSLSLTLFPLLFLSDPRWCEPSSVLFFNVLGAERWRFLHHHLSRDVRSRRSWWTPTCDDEEWKQVGPLRCEPSICQIRSRVLWLHAPCRPWGRPEVHSRTSSPSQDNLYAEEEREEGGSRHNQRVSIAIEVIVVYCVIFLPCVWRRPTWAIFNHIPI